MKTSLFHIFVTSHFPLNLAVHQNDFSAIKLTLLINTKKQPFDKSLGLSRTVEDFLKIDDRNTNPHDVSNKKAPVGFFRQARTTTVTHHQFTFSYTKATAVLGYKINNNH